MFKIIGIGILSLLGLVSNKPSPSPHVLEADRVAEKYMEASLQEGLSVFMYGGSMMDDIQAFQIMFDTHQKVTIDQARILFVRKVNEFLNLINNDQQIRPYLHNYPFTSKNIWLSIAFKDNDGGYYMGENDVAKISMPARSTIYYDKYDPTQPYMPFVDLYEEPFETAEKIVRCSNDGNK